MNNFLRYLIFLKMVLVIQFIPLVGLLQAVGAHHATEDFEFDQKLR